MHIVCQMIPCNQCTECIIYLCGVFVFALLCARIFSGPGPQCPSHCLLSEQPPVRAKKEHQGKGRVGTHAKKKTDSDLKGCPSQKNKVRQKKTPHWAHSTDPCVPWFIHTYASLRSSLWLRSACLTWLTPLSSVSFALHPALSPASLCVLPPLLHSPLCACNVSCCFFSITPCPPLSVICSLSVDSSLLSCPT